MIERILDILKPWLVVWANVGRITPELLQYRRLGLHHSLPLALCLTLLLNMILPISSQQLPSLFIQAVIHNLTDNSPFLYNLHMTSTPLNNTEEIND
jgi:hypothetical protein